MDAEELRRRRREKLLNRGKQIESGAITGIQEVIEEKAPVISPSAPAPIKETESTSAAVEGENSSKQPIV